METNFSIHFSIIIPVYNTTEVLRELSKRIEQVFTVRIGQSYEIIFIDDGSPNAATWPIVEDLVRKGQYIRAIQLTRNFGQHSAILCGLTLAKGKYLITMDDDLQHAPEDIPTLIALNKHDVVIGQFLQKKHSLSRNISSSFKSYFDQLLSGKPRNLRMTTFCLIQSNIARKMVSIGHTPYPLLSSLIFSTTKDVVGVPVSHSTRREGKSGYSLLKLMRLFGRLLLNNTSFVFRFVIWTGTLLFISSLIVLIGFITCVFFQQAVPIWLFLGLLILVSNGFILLMLGLLGLKLSRISLQTAQKKPYLIRHQIS